MYALKPKEVCARVCVGHTGAAASFCLSRRRPTPARRTPRELRSMPRTVTH